MPRQRPLPFHVVGQRPLYPDSVEVPAAVVARFRERLKPIGDRGCKIIRAVDEAGEPSRGVLDRYSFISWTDEAGVQRRIPAHRLALVLEIGPLPNDIMALHRCDVPACCCGDHAYPGSLSDNRADAAHAERARRFGWAPMLHPLGRERMCVEARPG